MALIDLVKKTDIVLKKRGITPIPSQVALAIDISGSMEDEYRDGIVQKVVERCLAVAMKFDADRQLDVWVFNSSTQYVGTVREPSIPDFVTREILRNPQVRKWGGTAYAPVLEAIQDHYYGRAGKKAGMLGRLFGARDQAGSEAVQAAGDTPVMVMLITDGENSDAPAFEATLAALRARRAYVQFVGIGNSDLGYLARVAEAEPHAGFVMLREFRRVSDEQLLEALLSPEFSRWVARQAPAAARV